MEDEAIDGPQKLPSSTITAEGGCATNEKLVAAQLVTIDRLDKPSPRPGSAMTTKLNRAPVAKYLDCAADQTEIDYCGERRSFKSDASSQRAY